MKYVINKNADFSRRLHGLHGAFTGATTGAGLALFAKALFEDKIDKKVLSKEEQKALEKHRAVWRKVPWTAALAGGIGGYLMNKGASDVAEESHETLLDKLETARENTNTNPSKAQINAGNYKKGKFRWKGFVISIENPRGSTRTGVDEKGRPWSVEMKYDYGYFLGYSNSDKEHMDVFIGDYPESEVVYVVDQQTAAGKHDEYKIVIGALSYRDAVKTYVSNYSNGAARYKSIIPMTIKQFKEFLVEVNEKNGMPEKVAALTSDVQLEPHQQKAVEDAEKNDGRMLFAHATGSGKTLTSIAAFEKLRSNGKAKKALVVVPSALRDNFVENLTKFTDSKYSVYGAKNEKSSKYIDEKDDSDYSIISYDMFRKDPDGIIENTGADTLIIDEIHRSRDESGATYSALTKATEKFKNVLTLTGSMVNNDPTEIVNLLDVTYGKKKHPLISKNYFDKAFISRVAKTHGFINPVVETHNSIKNKPQLRRAIGNLVSYIDHRDIEDRLPKRNEETIEVPMSDKQRALYNYALNEVNPVVRYKIKNNIPVNQSEMNGLFGKLMMARQIMTNPAKYDKELREVPITESSPKINAAVTNLAQYLDANPKNKAVVYGNLVQDQLLPMEEALKLKNIGYSTFYGTGNAGNTVKERKKAIDDFRKGNTRVALLSSAGSEGLDLKGTNLLQMLEGHYNPERIQQVEARIRRLSRGGEKQEPVTIQRYVTTLPPKGLAKAAVKLKLSKTPISTDQWIYNVAKRKDELNNEFRDTIKVSGFEDDLNAMRHDAMTSSIGGAFGNALSGIFSRRFALSPEKGLTQSLNDKGYTDLTQKKHLKALTNMSGLAESQVELATGKYLLGLGASGIASIVANKLEIDNPMARGAIVGGTALAAPLMTGIIPDYILGQKAKKGKRMDEIVEMYKKKLEEKAERKYKKSLQFASEFEARDGMNIDKYDMV